MGLYGILKLMVLQWMFTCGVCKHCHLEYNLEKAVQTNTRNEYEEEYSLFLYNAT